MDAQLDTDCSMASAIAKSVCAASAAWAAALAACSAAFSASTPGGKVREGLSSDEGASEAGGASVAMGASVADGAPEVHTTVSEAVGDSVMTSAPSVTPPGIVGSIGHCVPENPGPMVCAASGDTVGGAGV